MSNIRIAMIGGGNMGRAIASGLIDKGYDSSLIEIVEPDKERSRALKETLNVTCHESFAQITAQTDVVILAVKPQIMREVSEQLASSLSPSRDSVLIISIAAGISSDQLDTWLGGGLKIVRVMPNTPAMVGAGASALYANQTVDAENRTVAEEILSAVGITVWVDKESDIDAVTALSGSGPAYFFLVLEALEAEAVALGLEAATARQLAIQTALGSAMLAGQSTHDPQELRRQVTSPGGTTERAIEVLLANELPQAFSQALQAAYQRAKELGTQSN